MAEEGSRAIWKGWLPTFYGYSAQGAFKYGLYEVFKDQYANLLGKENFEKYKGLVWCAASASAEFFADIALCPLEMVKVKVQTAPKGTFPTAFGPAWSQMSAQRAETGFPYRSLVPLWSRQVPYTVAKFFFFEKVNFVLKFDENKTILSKHFDFLFYRSFNYFTHTFSLNQKKRIQKQHNSELHLHRAIQLVSFVP